MKAVGCAVLVVVAAFAGFFALAGWVITRSGEDQSSLTQQVTATVIGEPDRVGQAPTTSWRFDYAYEVDGQWYGPVDDASSKDEPADVPGEPVTVLVCIDPEDPARHALMEVGVCGDESIDGGSIDEATPRPAP